MKFFIGKILTEKLSDKIPRKKHNVDLSFEITAEQYEKLIEAINKFNSFFAEVQFFMLVDWNAREFFQLQNEYLDSYKEKRHGIFLEKPMYLNINRLILNWLTSVRTYLDYLETRIKRVYGSDSKQWKDFDRNTSKAYDENFSYRFIYRLRNYSQHCGFPIQSINLTIFPSDKNPEIPVPDLQLSALKSQLLIDFDWKNLREEIEQLPENIEMNPHVNNMMNSLADIHTSYVANEIETLRDPAEFINNMVCNIPDWQDHEVLHLIEIEILETGKGNFSIGKQLKPTLIPLKSVKAFLENDYNTFLNITLNSI